MNTCPVAGGGGGEGSEDDGDDDDDDGSGTLPDCGCCCDSASAHRWMCIYRVSCALSIDLAVTEAGFEETRITMAYGRVWVLRYLPTADG